MQADCCVSRTTGVAEVGGQMHALTLFQLPWSSPLGPEAAFANNYKTVSKRRALDESFASDTAQQCLDQSQAGESDSTTNCVVDAVAVLLTDRGVTLTIDAWLRLAGRRSSDGGGLLASKSGHERLTREASCMKGIASSKKTPRRAQPQIPPTGLGVQGGLARDSMRPCPQAEMCSLAKTACQRSQRKCNHAGPCIGRTASTPAQATMGWIAAG